MLYLTTERTEFTGISRPHGVKRNSSTNVAGPMVEVFQKTQIKISKQLRFGVRLITHFHRERDLRHISGLAWFPHFTNYMLRSNRMMGKRTIW
jgi:hypothetical protein